MADAAALRAQLAYLERSSPFYRERLAGARSLQDIPLLTKAQLREVVLHGRATRVNHLEQPVFAWR